MWERDSQSDSAWMTKVEHECVWLETREVWNGEEKREEGIELGRDREGTNCKTGLADRPTIRKCGAPTVNHVFPAQGSFGKDCLFLLSPSSFSPSFSFLPPSPEWLQPRRTY